MVKKREKNKVKKKKAGFKLSDITNVLQGTSPSPEVPKPKPDNSSNELSRREKDLLKLLADVTTGIWRIKNKFSDVDIDGLPDEIKKAHRHHESICDMLKNAKVEIRDHTGEKFPQGNPALKVIAFQPTPSVQYEVIAETIKPTIYYNGRLIQMGQVIVEIPQSKKSSEKLSSANSSSDRTSKQNNKDLAKNTEQSAKTEKPQDIDKNKERNKK